MRDIAFVAIIFTGLLWTLRYPYVGILLWTWITLMVPQELGFGFAQSFPINLIVAIVTIGAWIFSKERKLPPIDTTFILICLFLIWITINGFQAVDPRWSWPLWDRTWRIIALAILISIMATNRVRIHALILVIVLSLFYYGVKGGIFTLTTGGHFLVIGPPNSTIGDNNQLALAILMIIPLANYLRIQSANLVFRRAIFVAMILSFFSVVGSYSRGGFLALGVMVIISVLRAKKKWLYPLVAGMVVFYAYQFMPQSYFDRISTIQNPEADGSFQGRMDAWHVAYGYAKDNFPFGAGFSGPELPQIFSKYEPGKDTHAAHSIFFQVLGDNGFVGLAIYLLILAVIFWNSILLRHRTKNIPELSWVYDLSGMLQLTLIAFCVGGSALSFAYYDVLFIAAALCSTMRVIVDERLIATKAIGTNREETSSEISSARAF
jgi:putative inorganic carbon (hco3(-)) transporter